MAHMHGNSRGDTPGGVRRTSARPPVAALMSCVSNCWSSAAEGRPLAPPLSSTGSAPAVAEEMIPPIACSKISSARGQRPQASSGSARAAEPVVRTISFAAVFAGRPSRSKSDSPTACVRGGGVRPCGAMHAPLMGRQCGWTRRCPYGSVGRVWGRGQLCMAGGGWGGGGTHS